MDRTERRSSMQRKWIVFIAAGAAYALVLSACGPRQAVPTPTPTPTPGGGSQIANPASAYCAERGYVSQIRTASDGSQYGVCIFPDGTECEEWAFFRGECGPGAKPTATPVASQRISIPEISLSFNLPASWQRRGNDCAWVPAGDSSGRLVLSVPFMYTLPSHQPSCATPSPSGNTNQERRTGASRCRLSPRALNSES